ncbi:phage integrase N-terminal SAM-like domain-containing protein [Halomonas campaniensis]|uniref:phage integrase N-terminal SAM-like domain-containing protein n=1 Tax=Halomonas campaniensis TaxID=213554 RepID=UPI00197AFD6F
MKLMERVKATMRAKRYSLSTEKTYCYWIRFYIRFNNLRHPATLAGHEVRQFLEYLTIERQWQPPPNTWYSIKRPAFSR